MGYSETVTLLLQKSHLDVTQVSSVTQVVNGNLGATKISLICYTGVIISVTQVASGNLGATKISLICYTCVIKCYTGGKR